MEGSRHSLTHTHAYLQAVVKVTWNRHIMRKTENEKKGEGARDSLLFSHTVQRNQNIYSNKWSFNPFFSFPIWVCMCVCVHSAYHSKLKQRVNEVYT